MLSPSVSLTPKASSSQECTRLEKIGNGKGLTGGNLVLLQGLGIQNLERKQDMKVMITLFFFFPPPHYGSFTLSLTHLLELRDCAPAWDPCLHLYLLAPNLPPVSPDWAVLVGDLELEF